MTPLLRCTPPLSDRHRRWDGAESSPASPSGEAWHARGGLCAMAPSCADFLTGTAEWAPDEAEEKKYKHCEGGVVIGGCPRPSPSFFSLCKRLALWTGSSLGLRGTRTNSGRELGAQLAAQRCQDTHPAWRTPARNADHMVHKPAWPRRSVVDPARLRNWRRSRTKRCIRVSHCQRRAQRKQSSGPRSGLPTEFKI